MEKHLLYTEAHIEPDILSQFEETKKRKYEWVGDTKAAIFFYFWLRRVKETDEPNSEKNHSHLTANSPVILQNQSLEITMMM